MKKLLVIAFVAMLSSCGNATGEKSNTHDGHEYVDLGLSVKWATCNVGADSPDEPGYHFVWGEIGSSECGSYSTKHIYDLELTDIAGDKAHDAAAANWGGKWRMPTYKELLELCDKCEWEWTVRNGRTGCKVTGPNGNSIFLPASGMSVKTQVGAENVGGFYLGAGKSTLFNTTSVDILSLNSGDPICISYEYTNGASVRPVFSEP